MAKDSCSEILDRAYRRAEAKLRKSFISDAKITDKIAMVALCAGNRAGARFLLAATLAKVDKPDIDIRKPFIQAYDEELRYGAYGGRSYDEQYVFDFIAKHGLPCSPTTAFLTPAFRTKSIVLNLDQTLRGRPAQLYRAILEILDAIQREKLSAMDVLCELIRRLIIERDERQARLESLKKGLREESDELPLSSEETVRLIEQHLSLKHSSRLPVLVVAAAYRCASEKLREKVLRLNAHTAADSQTGALGDVEITLADDDKVVTTYEIKDKPVAIADIERAVQKIAHRTEVQNYIFVSTAPVDPAVREFAYQQYRELGGIEIALVDCVGFLRHFLHLFHRLRTNFLDEYQELVLSQPESGVNQALKEAFLALRRATQAGE